MGAPEVVAAIGLGSNLDDPAGQLERAVATLGELPHTRLLRLSSRYRTPPMGPADQDDYLNAVALLATRLGPEELLAALQGIEERHLRVRDRHWGPRTLDLDLLVYGDLCLDRPELTVPHPGLALRAFVVVPLAEIAPALQIPGLPTPAALARNFADAQITRL